ncbi:MAG: tRNA lysidine(34) synthetase TilS [Actinomycetota bacterium]
MTPTQGKVRHAVRATLASQTSPGQKLLLAVSGGADSLALAAATIFEAKKLELQLAFAIIDHQLQPGSEKVALRTEKLLTQLGATEVLVRKVKVGKSGGPEAAARDARYSALEKIKEETQADFILLGHTANDQAETVLLGLTRGSGARSLSGMRERNGIYLRPLLSLERSDTEQFCRDSEIKFWRDPHNQDPSFLRVRIRTKVLPFLAKELGAGIFNGLIRSAQQLREDSEYLELTANRLAKRILNQTPRGIELDVSAIEKLAPALRNRVIKIALESQGREMSRIHVLATAELVTDWHGQKPLSLPGVRVMREGKVIRISQEK